EPRIRRVSEDGLEDLEHVVLREVFGNRRTHELASELLRVDTSPRCLEIEVAEVLSDEFAEFSKETFPGRNAFRTALVGCVRLTPPLRGPPKPCLVEARFEQILPHPTPRFRSESSRDGNERTCHASAPCREATRWSYVEALDQREECTTSVIFGRSEATASG